MILKAMQPMFLYNNDIRDEISEIVCKYEQSCNILLAGDLNAALLKDAPNSRDKKHLSFINVPGVISIQD
jgi:hypothetical protein